MSGSCSSTFFPFLVLTIGTTPSSFVNNTKHLRAHEIVGGITWGMARIWISMREHISTRSMAMSSLISPDWLPQYHCIELTLDLKKNIYGHVPLLRTLISLPCVRPVILSFSCLVSCVPHGQIYWYNNATSSLIFSTYVMVALLISTKHFKISGDINTIPVQQL